MYRVTIELVPYGVEAMGQTIAELCMQDTSKDKDIADYQIAGYITQDGVITEFAIELSNFQRSKGVLALISEALTKEVSEFDKVELSDKLLNSTRLLAGERENENE